ncbi:hypothetical protein ACH4FX_19890 [Streptomyces sp. NPDC018019]|uniref:hypothetical protein n=1 Tax=Streptomyces sp. NPDC018019 TaxID=3365030 RepID=UPI0037B8AD43
MALAPLAPSPLRDRGMKPFALGLAGVESGIDLSLALQAPDARGQLEPCFR